MNVKPQRYVLEFQPDITAFSFTGSVVLHTEVEEPTDVVILNAADLVINEAHARKDNIIISAISRLNKKKEELQLKLSQKLQGKVELHIKFTGTLNDKLIGFYLSEYKENGTKKYLATTQFEAADARRAFPCIDEPSAKAIFDVTLIVAPHLTAISNMPVIDERMNAGKKSVRFAQTPIMSTYLLYLGVGEFEHISDKYNDVAIRVLTVKGKKEQARLALELTRKFLAYFDDYFGIPYPLPKLDLIALPDFASGAMENWGAITFRETMLLYDQKTSSQQTKEDIAEVVAHELAHQWFGNLVTMQWWNDLWLNESFATFMATKAVDHFYPEWDLWDQFLKTAVVDAMALDALENSHPINVDVKDPSEIREIFDSISYDKGGSVLRMLEDFVGAGTFQAGLNRYLTKHEYANATTHDLWRAIGDAAEKPIDEIMTSWVGQMGYPLITVTQKNDKLLLSQHRFLLTGKKPRTAWSIPITLATSKGKQTILLSERQASIPTGIPTSDQLIKLNASQKGFYRVKYDKKLLAGIKDAVQKKRLGNTDRWGVQHDLFALCLRGDLSVKEYIGWTAMYADDPDYLACSDPASNLVFFYLLSAGEPFWHKTTETAKQYLTTVFHRLGWEPLPNEKTTSKLLRSFTLTTLGKCGDDRILEGARQRFTSFLKDGNLDPDIRTAVYVLTAWQGDESTHHKLQELYHTAKTAEERVRFLIALSSFRDENILKKNLEFILSPEVKPQDLITPIMATASNPYGKTLIWPWMKKHWKEIASKFGLGSPLLNRALGSLAVLADERLAAEINAFFEQNHVPGTKRKLAQTLEKIKIHARLIEHMRKEFAEKN